MRINIIKKIVSTLFVCIMMISLVSCGNSNKELIQNEEGLVEITICLDWTPNTNHTGIYVADALGYYKEAGIAVTIVQPPEGGASAMCASGQAQFAIDAQDTMAAGWDMENPMEVTAVAGILQHNTSGIISRAGDGITSPKGLEDKVYSTWNSPIELAMIKYVMESEGGDFNKVQLIPNNITDEPSALKMNQTDAIWIFYGWSGINAQISEVAFDYWNFSDICEELDYYTPIIIANNKFLESNAEIATLFLEATKKGYEYAVENPKEAADILIAGDDTGSLVGAKDLVYASQEWVSREYIADEGEWGIIDEERWNLFYTWLFENQLTKNDLTGKGYSNEYWRK